jgi:hypothetical protein
MGRALRACGHIVDYGPPSRWNDSYDSVLVGLASPLSSNARHALSAMALLGELHMVGPVGLAVFVDDPDLKKISSGHRSAVRNPNGLFTDYLMRNRSTVDKMLVQEKSLEEIIYGAYMVSNPPTSYRTVTFRQAWHQGWSASSQLPAGVQAEYQIDLSPVLLDADFIIDMGVESASLGHYARNRADVWTASTWTTSRQKSPWVEGAMSTVSNPAFPAPDIRHKISDGFSRALVSMGVLEQPVSSTIIGWWTPWPALAVAAKAFYGTDPQVCQSLGRSYRVIPAYYESLSEYARSSIVDDQRSDYMKAVEGWSMDRICSTVITAASGNVTYREENQ